MDEVLRWLFILTVLGMMFFTIYVAEQHRRVLIKFSKLADKIDKHLKEHEEQEKVSGT